MDEKIVKHIRAESHTRSFDGLATTSRVTYVGMSIRPGVQSCGHVCSAFESLLLVSSLPGGRNGALKPWTLGFVFAGNAKAAVGCAGAAAGAAAAATLPAPGGCGDSGVRLAAGSGEPSGPEGGGDTRFIRAVECRHPAAVGSRSQRSISDFRV